MRTKASFPPQIVGFYVSGRRAAHPPADEADVFRTSPGVGECIGDSASIEFHRSALGHRWNHHRGMQFIGLSSNEKTESGDKARRD
jgi:hypothetical protein